MYTKYHSPKAELGTRFLVFALALSLARNGLPDGTARTGPPRQDWAAKIRWPGQDRKDRTVRTGLAEQDR